MDDRTCRDTPSGASGAHRLEVYAMPDCPGWHRAQALAAVATEAGVPGLVVRVIDLSQGDIAVPDSVVASPTWVLNDRRIAFGNPDLDWLLTRLGALGGGE